MRDTRLLDALARAASAAAAGETLAESVRREAPALGALALELAEACDRDGGLAAGLEARGLLTPLGRAAIAAAGRDAGRLCDVIGRLRHASSTRGRYRGMLRWEILPSLIVVFVGISTWSVIAVYLNSFASAIADSNAFGPGISWVRHLQVWVLASVWPGLVLLGACVLYHATRDRAPSLVYRVPRLGDLRRRADAWELIGRLRVAGHAGMALGPAVEAIAAETSSKALAGDLRRLAAGVSGGRSASAALGRSDGMPADVAFQLGEALDAPAIDDAALATCAAALDQELRREILDLGYGAWVALVVLALSAVGTNHPATSMQPLIEALQMF